MTDREYAAFRAGIEAARQMALTAAVILEIRPDAREVRQQAQPPRCRASRMG